MPIRGRTGLGAISYDIVIRTPWTVDPERLRRLAGVVLVVLLVAVLLAGLAHVTDADHGGASSHDCGLCLALFQLAVGLPVLAALLGASHGAAARHLALVRDVRPAARGAHPPPARGPPSPL